MDSDRDEERIKEHEDLRLVSVNVGAGEGIERFIVALLRRFCCTECLRFGTFLVGLRRNIVKRAFNDFKHLEDESEHEADRPRLLDSVKNFCHDTENPTQSSAN